MSQSFSLFTNTDLVCLAIFGSSRWVSLLVASSLAGLAECLVLVWSGSLADLGHLFWYWIG